MLPALSTGGIQLSILGVSRAYGAHSQPGYYIDIITPAPMIIKSFMIFLFQRLREARMWCNIRKVCVHQKHTHTLEVTACGNACSTLMTSLPWLSSVSFFHRLPSVAAEWWWPITSPPDLMHTTQLCEWSVTLLPWADPNTTLCDWSWPLLCPPTKIFSAFEWWGVYGYLSNTVRTESWASTMTCDNLLTLRHLCWVFCLINSISWSWFAHMLKICCMSVCFWSFKHDLVNTESS